HRDAAVTGDEDDRQRVLRRAEPLLELEAVEIRQIDVEDQAARRALSPKSQEVGGGDEARDVESRRAREANHGLAGRHVVIDDVDRRPAVPHDGAISPAMYVR